LVGILDVTEQEDLMITCKSGLTIRMPVNGISEQGRATQGVKLIRLDENDEIAAITKLDKLEEENGNGVSLPEAGAAAPGIVDQEGSGGQPGQNSSGDQPDPGLDPLLGIEPSESE